MRLVLAAALAVITSAAYAGDVDFTYETFRKSRTGALEIVLKFTNGTNRDVSFARAECAFLDGSDRAVTTENVIVQNVSAGGYAYGKNYVMEPGATEKAECRLTAVDY